MEKMQTREPSTRQCLTIGQRCVILQRLEAGELSSHLADEYKITRSAISRIRKDKERIFAVKNILEDCDGDISKKRYRGAENTVFEKELYKWFLEQSKEGSVPNGPQIKKQALLYKDKFNGPAAFKASDGWLNRFKQRHCIALSTDRKAPVDPLANNASDEFKEKMANIMNVTGISADYIYTAVETSLYWKLLPNSSFVAQNKKSGTKLKPRNRVTIMACTNSSGTHKMNLLVIGKPQSPRCFRNIAKLPIYASQENASMDKDLMMKWYTTVFLPEVQQRHDLENNQNQRVFLILDDAENYPTEEVFNGLCFWSTVLLLPAHTTSPLEYGIMEKLKKSYRSILLNKIIADTEDCLKSINLLDCCTFCELAWSEVTSVDIRSCCKKLVPLEEEFEMEIVDSKVLQSLLHRIPSTRAISLKDTIKWLNIDNTISSQDTDAFEELDDEVNSDDEDYSDDGTIRRPIKKTCDAMETSDGVELRADGNIPQPENGTRVTEAMSDVEFSRDDGNIRRLENERCTVDAMIGIKKYINWYEKHGDNNQHTLKILRECQQLVLKAVIQENT